MPRPRKSPGERARRRAASQKRYQQTVKGKAAQRRAQATYDGKRRADLTRAQAVEQQARKQPQEIRDDSGQLIAVRLPDGTIQAIATDPGNPGELPKK